MPTAAILTISDSRSAGTRRDETTSAIAGTLGAAGIEVVATRIVPDEHDEIAAALIELAGEASLVLTSGGTGLAPRDVTPEATLSVLDREARGIAEALRAGTSQATPLSWLSRGVAGQRGGTLIVNLPGAPKAVREYLEILVPMLGHALRLAAGDAAHG